MNVGDLVQPRHHYIPRGTCHGIVLKITKSCGDLGGYILVQWFGAYGDRVKAHDATQLKKIEENT